MFIFLYMYSYLSICVLSYKFFTSLFMKVLPGIDTVMLSRLSVGVAAPFRGFIIFTSFIGHNHYGFTSWGSIIHNRLGIYGTFSHVKVVVWDEERGVHLVGVYTFESLVSPTKPL